MIEYAQIMIKDISKNVNPIRPIDSVIWGNPWIIKRWIPKKMINEIKSVKSKFLLFKFPIEKYIIRPIKGMVNKFNKWSPVAKPMV